MQTLRLLAGLSLVAFAGCGALKRCAYEGLDRDSWQEPERVIASLGIEAGDCVADIGAGGGYFTFRLAEAVGPAGRVYAVDVDEDMTGFLEGAAAEEGHENVEVILAELDDPLLPDGEIDLVFSSNTFHHLEDRSAYFERVRKDLREGGRVAIIEFRETSWFAKHAGHATPKEAMIEEMAEAGFQVDQDFDFLERQHFLVFRATQLEP